MPSRGGALLAATVTALGIMAGTAAAKPLYGVVPQDGALPSANDLGLMPKAGIARIRLMASWGTVERLPGLYDWGTMDAMVRESTKRGVQPLFFLYGTPEWAARQDDRNCRGNACMVFAPRSPETRAAFANFAAAAVNRYGPGGEFWESPVPAPVSEQLPEDSQGSSGGVACPIPILCPPEPPPPVPPGPVPGPGEPPCGCSEPSPITAWQVWNEQNSPKYFAPRVSVERYAELLQSASAAIKAADPAAEVILGGMWGPGSAHNVVLPVKPYLKQLYRIDGIADSFDSIALHPYAPNTKRSIDQIEVARKRLRRSGDRDAGTWITELGWAADGPSDNPYVKGLDGQARLLSRTLKKFSRRARSFRLKAVFWYSWRDKAGGETICEWCGHAGLRARDGSAKPAWKAFARVARS